MRSVFLFIYSFCVMYGTARLGTAIPNPDLIAEYSVNYELGYKGLIGSKLDLETALFYSKIQNTISMVSNVLPDPVRNTWQSQLQNVGEAEFSGIEAALTYNLVRSLKAGINYTFIERRNAACANCHGGPKTYTELFQNNGLNLADTDPDRETITGQPVDNGRFRVVTLRNIALTSPYMHDGRFKKLEEVLDHYNEHVKPSPTLSPFLKNNSNIAGSQSLGLTVEEKDDIISFLNTLTDSVFITDPRFSNPFK